MDTQSVEEICRQGVLEAAQAERWEIGAEAITALAQVILPFLPKEGEITKAGVKTVAVNYYHDGPMVHEMLTIGSADGEKLWQDWRHYILHLARAQQLDPEQAEDLVQEVYIHTTAALRNFRFACRLRTYFHSIFINRYRRWRRNELAAKQREHTLPQPEQAEDSQLDDKAFLDPNPSPETATVQSLQNEEIRHIVEQEIHKIVGSEVYQILFLYYAEQTFIDPVTAQQKRWTDQAIAEHVGILPNTVTSKRRRALERLGTYASLRELFMEIVGGEPA